jgi:ppGpp synthetase/RelA/SpoT-type nucleotidyltranferase
VRAVTVPDSKTNYLDAVDGLDGYGRMLTGLLSALLVDAGLSILAVQYRVKDHASAVKKMHAALSRYPDFESMHDLLGIRVITHFSKDVDPVGRIVEEEFAVDEENSVDKRRLLDVREFGYLSLHFVLALDSKRARLPEYQKYAGRHFELQIRSTLQHAWAEIEHDLGYKGSNTLPENLRRQFSQVAGVLEMADEAFDRLRDEIDAGERRALEEVGQAQPVELDSLNALAVVRTNAAASSLEAYIAGLLGSMIEPASGTSTYGGKTDVEMLRALGIDTVQALESYYKANSEELREFASQWIDRPPAGHSIAEGISLYYVQLYALSLLNTSARRDLINRFETGMDGPQYRASFARVAATRR